MTTKYFRNAAGDYLGAFGEGVSAPDDGIEVTSPPADNADQKWMNGAWQPLPADFWQGKDQDRLNAALTQEGSVVRALGLVMFDAVNALRVKTGDKAYTMPQFLAALKAKMR